MPGTYILWLIFFIGAGAGLMIIGNVAVMARQSLGDLAWVAVTVLALGNAAGRIVAGALSDRMGRGQTMMLVMFFQAGLMFGLLALPRESPALVLSRFSQMIVAATGSNDYSYIVAGCLLLVGGLLTFALRAPRAVGASPDSASSGRAAQ